MRRPRGRHEERLFIFVADLYRNSRIRAERGIPQALGSDQPLFPPTALEDALLARRTSVVAAESTGRAPSTSARSSPIAHRRQALGGLTFPIVDAAVGRGRARPSRACPFLSLDAQNTCPRVGYSETLADFERANPPGRPALGFAPRVFLAPGVPNLSAWAIASVWRVLHEQRLCLR